MSPSFAFLIAAMVPAVTPGPAIACVVARTVTGGRMEGWASCFGAALGGMLHVLAAVLVAQSAFACFVAHRPGNSPSH